MAKATEQALRTAVRWLKKQLITFKAICGIWWPFCEIIKLNQWRMKRGSDAGWLAGWSKPRQAVALNIDCTGFPVHAGRLTEITSNWKCLRDWTCTQLTLFFKLNKITILFYKHDTTVHCYFRHLFLSDSSFRYHFQINFDGRVEKWKCYFHQPSKICTEQFWLEGRKPPQNKRKCFTVWHCWLYCHQIPISLF